MKTSSEQKFEKTLRQSVTDKAVADVILAAHVSSTAAELEARIDENYVAAVINEQFGGTGKGTTDVAVKLSERRTELKQRRAE